MASGANPQTVQLKPTDGFFCQETKTPKTAIPAFPQMLSLSGRGSGGTVGHGEPHELHLFPVKGGKQPLKAGLHPLSARSEAGRCDGSRAEHQMHVRHWQVWDEARATWVREGKNGKLPAGPSTGSPSRQAMSIRRKRSSFKSF